MTLPMPTMPVENVSFKTDTVEFKGTVITYYGEADYILPKEFVGTAKYPMDDGRISVEGTWEKGPIFRRLKFMALKNKDYLYRAKEQARKIKLTGDKPW